LVTQIKNPTGLLLMNAGELLKIALNGIDKRNEKQKKNHNISTGH